MTIDLRNTEVINSAGNTIKLGEYEGKVLLIVNVASFCGNTVQYNDLQKLHEEYSAKGLKILAFPCNDYANQEPGTLDEIKEFCTVKYGVKFEIFSKVHAKGITT